MKVNELFRGGLLWCIAILGLYGCSFANDWKTNEIVDDPMTRIEEYYIVGMVFDKETAEPLLGVSVKTGEISVKTDVEGKYKITLDSRGTFDIEFSKDNYITVSTTAELASEVANRSMVTLGIKMSPKNEAMTITSDGGAVTSRENSEESGILLQIPEGALAEGEICSIGITSYDIPQQVSTTIESGDISFATPLAAIAVETNRVSFREPVKMIVKNAVSPDVNFTEASVWGKDNLDNSRAPQGWSRIGTAIAEEGNCFFESNELNFGYIFEINARKHTDAEDISEYNRVNGRSELKIDNTGNSNAVTDVEIQVEAKAGWDFIINPTEALTAAGVGRLDLPNLASTIQRIVEAQEGGFARTYTVTYNYQTNVSGNYIMYYTSRARYREKTYTFDIAQKNGTSIPAFVKVKAYTGMKETYMNESQSQHSGGKI